MKPGYKQTEVGVIPEEWEVVPFKELAHIERGKFTARPRNDPKYYGGDIPFIQTGDVTNANGEITTYSQTLNLAGLKVSKQFPRGTLFFTIAANIGDVGFAAFDTACPDSLVAITPSKLTDKKWLAYELAKRKTSFESIATHNAQLNINLEKLRPYLLPHPPLPEQRAIAEALSDVDGLLGALDRLIAKKRDLKQAAMQQLLTGQTRLPGFEGEWDMTRLKNLVTMDKFAIVDGPFGSQLKVDEYVESGVPIIEMEHLVDKVVTQQIDRCITPKKFDELKRSAVYPGDILISKTGSLGKLGIIPDSVEKGLITSRLAKITLSPFRADRYFIFQCLLKHRRDGYWEKVSQGGTMQILGIGMLQNTPIPDISLPEQAAIAEVLSEMDLELAGLEQRREKTRALKQGMMQELLTGKTRLRQGSGGQARLVQPAGLGGSIAKEPKKKGHNWEINEAVVISVLTKHFGTQQFPLGRKRYTKFSYLLHRYKEHETEGYLKKAAGPYNPATKYKGPEGIAEKNGYISRHKNGKFSGFVAAKNIAKAEAYFDEWYGEDSLKWLMQFRRKSNDELELLATVDMAMEELRKAGKPVSQCSVKGLIDTEPEWKPKLSRDTFSDFNIARAMRDVERLFGG